MERMRAAAAFGTIFLFITVLRFGANVLTYAAGVVSVAVFLFFLLYGCQRLAYYGMSFLAVQCMLNVFYDLRTLIVVSASHARTISDASMLSRETFGVIPRSVGLSDYPAYRSS
jgi:hypothetical protein